MALSGFKKPPVGSNVDNTDYLKDKAAEQTLGSLIQLPREMIFGIINNLSPADIRRLACVSHSFNDEIFGCFPTTTYFTVSHHIHLFPNHSYYNEMTNTVTFSRYVENVDLNLIKSALSKYAMILFEKYDEAKSYCKYAAKKSFDATSDIFVTESIPAILVVKIHPADLFKKTVKSKIELTTNIPECPHPPMPKTKQFSILKMTANKIDVHFAIFNGTLFCKPSPERQFKKIWDDAFNMNSLHNIQEKLTAALIALFNSYISLPHHYLTRHHSDKVRDILDLLINKKEPISTIFNHLTTFLNVPNGHFKKMIEFALTVLQPYEDANKLNGIETIFTNNRIQLSK